jgi:23S rRNA pseudouridine1911/1915/1917 synthase
MGHPTTITVSPEHATQRLDQFLASYLHETSRARIQQLIAQEKVLVDGKSTKPSIHLRGGEKIEILGEVERPALRAMAEEIPLDIVYEDDDLAVVNKAAGMKLHAGRGETDAARNRGTGQRCRTVPGPLPGPGEFAAVIQHGWPRIPAD